MDRPPRDPHEPLFGADKIVLSLLQGVVVLFAVLSILGLALYVGQDSSYARAQTFATLVAGIVALIFTNRSWSRSIIATFRSPNGALWWVIGGAIGFLVSVLYVPYLREVFHFASLRPRDLAICFAAGALSVVWFEVVKLIRSKRRD